MDPAKIYLLETKVVRYIGFDDMRIVTPAVKKRFKMQIPEKEPDIWFESRDDAKLVATDIEYAWDRSKIYCCLYGKRFCRIRNHAGTIFEAVTAYADHIEREFLEQLKRLSIYHSRRTILGRERLQELHDPYKTLGIWPKTRNIEDRVECIGGFEFVRIFSVKFIHNMMRHNIDRIAKYDLMELMDNHHDFEIDCFE